MKLTDYIIEMKEKYPNENSLIEYYNSTSEEFLKKFERDDVECYSYYYRTDRIYSKEFYNILFDMFKDWDVVNVSPYSASTYNSYNISWGYKPEGSLRIADHWNFESHGDKHCLMEDETRNDHTMLCKYVNGIYRVIEDYTEKYGDNFIYANL